jgi:S-adenosyl-L-methionine hydrolase (adenosine-forming)
MLTSAFQANSLVTLTTDFGVSDPYVGVMKGVILARHPAARLVDLTHQVPAFQPSLAGFWLARVWPHFPPGTVHLAVLDPGVGTERGMVLLLASGQVFVAPDNGLLEPVFRSAPRAQWRAFQLSDLGHLQLPTPSQTFHGRDIFAPLVAEIAASRQPPESLGRAIEHKLNPTDSPFRQGRIVHADHYGNLITDIEASCLEGLTNPAVWFRTRHITVRKSYGFAPSGELLGLVNSWGTLEIALAQGSAQQHLQAQPGESVRVEESPPASGPAAG